MTTRPRRWLPVAWLGGGLGVLVVLWLPYTAVTLSFSGPTRVVTHVGLLSAVERSTRYAPRRLGTSLGAVVIKPPPLKPGEVIWDHRGEMGSDLVILAVQEQAVTVHPLAFVHSVLGTLVVLWLAVVRPGQKLIQSWQPARAGASSNPWEYSSAVGSIPEREGSRTAV